MPDIVETCYRIEGPKETLQKIYDSIENHWKKLYDCPDSPEDNEFDFHDEATEYFERDLLDDLNIYVSSYSSISLIKDQDDYYLRGWVKWCKLCADGTLYMYAEEAWQLTDFAKALMANIPDIKIYYEVISWAPDLSGTNDVEGKYFPYRFFVYTVTNGYEYFYTKEDAWECVEELTGCKNEDDVESFNEKNKGDFVYITEIKVVDDPLCKNCCI